MKKLTLLIAAVAVGYSNVSAQGCLPEGIKFTKQSDIDNFQTNYPGCTEVEGYLQVQGDEITNLNGLSVLTSIGGLLHFYTCTALPDMSGLENLTTIGGNLDIYVWPSVTTSMTSLSGLDNLVSIGGALKLINTDALTNLTGLGNLTTIGGDINISGNEILTDLSGLDNLSSVGGDIQIGGNSAMTSVAGLEALTTVGGAIVFYENEALISLTGIANIEAASIDDYIRISYNSSLSDCAVQSICDYIALPGTTVDLYQNAPGCNTFEEVEIACNTHGTESISSGDKLLIRPNPVSGFATLQFEGLPSGKVSICILNTTGICLKTQEFSCTSPGQQQFTLNLADLPAGLYFCRVECGNVINVKKIIKR